MTVSEFIHAGLLCLEAIALAATAVLANRARRSAREAKVSERAAWLSAANADRDAKRLDDVLPPDVLPFPTPEQLRAVAARDENDEPDVIGLPLPAFKPRLFKPRSSS